MKLSGKVLLILTACLFIVVCSSAQKKKKKDADPPPAVADSTKKPGKPPTPPKPTVEDKVKSSKKVEGLFTLYQDTATGGLQIYINKDQLEREYIYQSFSMGGPTSLFLNQNMIRATIVFNIKKRFDKIEFSEVNTGFWYDPENPVSKAANVDVTDAIFYNVKIDAEDSLGYLIAGDGLFLSDKLDPIKPLIPPGPAAQQAFNLGNLNAGKSTYNSIRSYPDNTDVIVELAFDNPAPFNGGGKDITDARYNRIRFQHSFLAMPENDFSPRYDDPRVGYFMQEVDNLTTIKVADYKDVINRWNLKKKDPNATISEPVEPIVWWVENTTPIEYRQTIVEAGLKWNEAFEKAGFRNAVVMKIMPDNADWDPADIRYNVIRWVSSPNPPYGAIGPSFTNPKTGQILGADITVEWATGSFAPIAEELFDVKSMSTDLPSLLLGPVNDDYDIKRENNWMACTLGKELKAQFTAGLTVLEANDASPEEIKELHKQFLYYLIMHEMGHTLGLNHNMKATQMLSPAEVHNKEITRKIGLQGSVMDYPAMNVSSDRNKQGDYYTTKAGPYDIWAIEFGYTQFTKEQEKEGLKKILIRSTDPQLAFGNDADDMRNPGRGGIDPRVMINDMSNDMVTYAEDRMALVNTLIGKLKDKYSKPGQSYAELRSRYGTLMGQRVSMANSVSRFIGGVMVDRSFVGQDTKTKPFTPVPVAYQKKAMAFLAKYIFAPDAFDVDAQLFPYLQIQRRGFDFFGGPGEDIKPQTNVLSLQVNLFAHFLSANTMSRINNSSLYGNTYTVADVLNDVTDAVFNADLKTNVNLYRLNLQTEYVKGLSSIATAPVSPYDNASKAAVFYTLKKIKTKLASAVSTNEQTRAHRANLIFMIDNALTVK